MEQKEATWISLIVGVPLAAFLLLESGVLTDLARPAIVMTAVAALATLGAWGVLSLRSIRTYATERADRRR